jgi:hypothetical protein
MPKYKILDKIKLEQKISGISVLKICLFTYRLIVKSSFQKINSTFFKIITSYYSTFDIY